MKHSIVLLNKQAIVIGPTPPGTGVIAFATLETSSKSTSPSKPFSVLFIPTSITIAPFFTQSPLTNFGSPTAATIISALLHSFFKSLVLYQFFNETAPEIQNRESLECSKAFQGAAYYNTNGSASLTTPLK